MGFLPTKPQVYACLSLALLFSSIWLTDRLSELILSLPNLVLVMRVFSLFWYAALFVVLVAYRRRRRMALDGAAGWRFLRVASYIGIACFLVGIGVIVYAFAVDARLFQNQPLFALLALFLLKAVGAPVSVLLICAFARLRQSQTVVATLVGYALSFALYALLSFVQTTNLYEEVVPVLIACVMMVGALLLGLQGLRVPAPRVITRPYRQIVTANFVVGVMIASIMLGYLRSTTLQEDPNAAPGVIVALVLVALVAFLRRGLREDVLFKIALGCTAAGILLHPLLTPLFPNIESFLMGFGSDLFEIIVWVLAVWAARNCQEQLLAAGASRLAIVGGHLLGTVIAVASLALLGSGAEALQASSLLVVFIFVILLLFFSQNPRVELPIFAPHYPAEGSVRPVAVPEGSSTSGVATRPDAESGSDASDGSGVLAGPDGSAMSKASARSDASGGSDIAAPSAASTGTSPMPASDSAPTLPLDQAQPDDQEDPYWQDPCAYVAGQYGLTARETSILEQLARGRDLNFMAEKFVLSPNTVKMHIRNIYQKLDVHSKQDVINMVEKARQSLG